MAERWLVCGGRSYSNADIVNETLDRLCIERGNPEIVIQGGAVGADFLAQHWANHRRILSKSYPADWVTYKNAAGPIRNSQMLKDGKPDLVIAFPGGKGTADMVRKAELADVEVIRVE